MPKTPPCLKTRGHLAIVVYPINHDALLTFFNGMCKLTLTLNTTNFRDVLFERFMNAKFYDIGLMGRKRLNKKLRLNIPLQCTTLTPLDFLAIFYKLFSLYNNFSLIQNFFPTQGNIPIKIPFLGDSLTLNPKANSWSESKLKTSSSSGSVTLRELMSINMGGSTLPLALPGIGNVFKPRHHLLDTTPLSGSLDHLNQRHIRTSGEFLFLQFWRAILRFYQVLSQLSSRSNFIKSSYTAAGKTGRNFFSLSSISLFPSDSSSISNQTEYIVPISNNQTHVLKAYGYLNMTNSNHDAFNFNLYQYQCFQNTIAGEFVVRPRLSFQSNRGSGLRGEKVEAASNKTSLNSNKITGSYPNNFRREILNSVINRNDLNSILPYTPYLQTSVLSTCAQFQNFSLKQNERDFAYARYYKRKLKISQPDIIDNNQDYHLKSESMVRSSMFFHSKRNYGLKPNNLSLMTMDSLMERPKKKIKRVACRKNFNMWPVSLKYKRFRQPYFLHFSESHRRLSILNMFKMETFANDSKPNRLKGTTERSNSEREKRFKIQISWPGRLKNSVSNLNTYTSAKSAIESERNLNKVGVGFNSKIETIIKKLLYETKASRVFDAKERMRNLETKLFNGVFKEFFNLDPLSQDLDETNGLSEIIHKRRISALGKGGVTSKNAPLSIRSIHPSFYGRLCPIDSPEGDRVGLINSLTNYARINKTGYIATPFYRTRQHDHVASYVNNRKKFSFNRGSDLKGSGLSMAYKINPLLAQKSTLQMRICVPISFLSKISNSYEISPSLRISFQDITYNLGKIKETIKWKISNQNYSKQVFLQIGETQFERTYKYFMNSLDLRPDSRKKQSPVKKNLICLSSEISLLGRKSITGNPFIYRSKQNHFKSTRIHDFRKGLEPIPSFGLTKTQQRGLIYSDFMILPRNLQETVQNNFFNRYVDSNSIAHLDKHTKSHKLELFLFYDTHYMTPPITLHDNIINNSKDKNSKPVSTPFLTSYFDFISFQGYAPITAFQFFSPGVGLIPFLEHDDGTRALMGANMQRQAVPLIEASRPIVGTGLEKTIAASFIISSSNSGYLYYISGKQSKQMFSGLSNNIYVSSKPKTLVSHSIDFLLKETKCLKPYGGSSFNGFKTSRKVTTNRLVKETQFLDSLLSLKNLKPLKNLASIPRPIKPHYDFDTSTSLGFFKKRDEYSLMSHLLIHRTVKNKMSRTVRNYLFLKQQIKWPVRAKTTYRPISLNKPVSHNFKNDHHFILNTHWLPYRKSYKATIINKKPAILENSWLQKGDLLVDGTSSINGELALGRNLFSIYMPWEGYNFEDAILISDKAAQSYTTIHVEEFSVKISKNESVSSIVKPFTWVNLGDILVSKKRKLENEFIMNRLLFGMSSKPKVKNLDNDSVFEAESNYNFYGNKSFLNRQAPTSQLMEAKPWLTSRENKKKVDGLLSERSMLFNKLKSILRFGRAAYHRVAYKTNRQTLGYQQRSAIVGQELYDNKVSLNSEPNPSFSYQKKWMFDRQTVSAFKFLNCFRPLSVKKKNAFMSKTFLNTEDYVISPWRNKLWSNYYRRIQNFTRPVTIINQSGTSSPSTLSRAEGWDSNKENSSRSPKFQLPPCFYYGPKFNNQYFNIGIPSAFFFLKESGLKEFKNPDASVLKNVLTQRLNFKTHVQETRLDTYSVSTRNKAIQWDSKNYNCVNQTTQFRRWPVGFFKKKAVVCKPNNRLKVRPQLSYLSKQKTPIVLKYHYETSAIYNKVNMCKSQLAFPFEEEYSVPKTINSIKTWSSKNKQFDVGVLESLNKSFLKHGFENQLFKKTYIDNPYFLFIPPLFHMCYRTSRSLSDLFPLTGHSLTKSWLYNATHSFVSLHYKKKILNNSFFRERSVKEKPGSPKQKDSRWFLANFKEDVACKYYFLQNFHELYTVFSKVIISGETSYITEQAFRNHNETLLDTNLRLDDKPSSLVSMNEKDLKAFRTQPSITGPLKKNDNFEIDTSYRTGESICGWVISVKSQSQHSLFSDNSNQDRVRVLDPKTGMLEQTYSKNRVACNMSKLSKTVDQSMKVLDRLKDQNHDNITNRPVSQKTYGPPPHNESLNTRNTESKTWPSLKPIINISKGDRPKLLSERFAREKKFNMWPSSFIGDLLLKGTLKTLNFAWKSPKKPNQIYLKWLINNSKIQFLKKLSFRPPSSNNSKNKSYSFNVYNPYTIPRVKTEPTQLKVTKNLKPPPTSDTISIYVAVAKPLQVGDKMSGRHGNKGIISKILPFYDMPYLIDGTPIDIVLNPLGVPSRMNVGQIYESLLGLTGFYKQEYYRIPPFDENYSFQFSRNFVYWKLNELKNLHFFTFQTYNKISKNSVNNMTLLLPYSNKQTYGPPPNNLIKPCPTYRPLFLKKKCSLPLRPLPLFEKNELQATAFPFKKHYLFRLRFTASLKKVKVSKPYLSKTNALKWLGTYSSTYSNRAISRKRKNLKMTKYIRTKLSNKSYDGLNILWPCQQFSIDGSLNTGLPINWNTSFLGCPKSKILGSANHFSKFKSFNNTYRLRRFKFFSDRLRSERLRSDRLLSFNNNVYSLKSSFKENWFFNFKNLQAKPFSLSKLNMTNLSFCTPKNHLNTLFINQNRPTVEKFGLNPYFPGKMRLLNGLTGETFYRPIIVGKSYMLKLIHLVHHKIHARATGPYALITQQPLKGKRNQGGQRMGEMEIWALYGFGSASILYEMLTIKSDDPVGRERILRDIAGLKGNNSSNSHWKINETRNALSLREPTEYWKNEESKLGSKVNDSLEKGISESFRVLVMNLRALCLDMQVFKDLPN